MILLPAHNYQILNQMQSMQTGPKDQYIQLDSTGTDINSTHLLTLSDPAPSLRRVVIPVSVIAEPCLRIVLLTLQADKLRQTVRVILQQKVASFA
ncbi:hypothetical protein BJM06_04273 [Enterobacter cloacae]|nr:hypothetical protein BJM06_04273 [Enterobacter cloacae]